MSQTDDKTSPPHGGKPVVGGGRGGGGGWEGSTVDGFCFVPFCGNPFYSVLHYSPSAKSEAVFGKQAAKGTTSQTSKSGFC